jgi:hypothetical protein
MSQVSEMYYKVDQGVPLFYFNGEKMPGPGPEGEVDGNGYTMTQNPGRGYLMKTEQLVKSTRNSNGQVVAQKINRRLLKFDSLKYPLLTRKQVVWLKQKVANFTVRVTYYDDELDKVISRLFYFGDMSAEPIQWESVSLDGGKTKFIKRPSLYKDVSVNIIDMRVLTCYVYKLNLQLIRKKGERLC